MANTSKKLINAPTSCVDDCLIGLVKANTGLQILDGHRVVIRSDIEEVKAAGKVTLLSGGGSGHEPAHAGYIGKGMLSGAIAGAVFTSPPPGSIVAAIRTVGQNNPGGTLLIVKNYTGDRLNFGIAAERAKSEGISVDMVVVGEDCALTSADKSAGRRGLCGTVLIHKIAGAMAEGGCSLKDISQHVKKAAASMGTIGLSLSPCSVPGSGPSFQLKADEMELGLGIHGEAGVRRIKVVSAKEAVATMLDHMTSPTSSTHLDIPSGSRVVLMVNNLGGTSMLELGIVTKEAIQYLEGKDVCVERVYTGAFMTSLEMAGISLTVLLADQQTLKYLDASTDALGWTKPLRSSNPQGITMKYEGQRPGDAAGEAGIAVDKETAQLIYKCLEAVCTSLVAREAELNELDAGSGDGDCGTTMTRGATGVLKALGSTDCPGLPVNRPHALLLALAKLTEEQMGGSSGAMYSLFLTAAASPLFNSTATAAWVQAMAAGLLAVMKYGGAEPGDRTMVDSLHAASQALSSAEGGTGAVNLLQEASKAAESAAEATTHMKAKAGRASYVNTSLLTKPDPGAVSISIIMKALHSAVTS